MFEQLGLIGCGLMGGSFALALKRAGLVKRVVGYSKSPSTTQRAREMGVIDLEAPSALLAVSGADLVLLAVPVAATEDTLSAIRHLVLEGALLMDVGSTKQNVIDAVHRVLRTRAGMFVPAHPIAGRELAGVEHADADLYQGRQVILTPTEQTLSTQLRQAQELWAALGCQVRQMSAQAHDAAYAAVSHLPHLLAFALMNAIVGQAQAQEFLSLAGPGFRDFTRIAASNPDMWRDILMANRHELLAQTKHFEQALATLHVALTAGDAQALEYFISQASDAREQWRMTQALPPTVPR